MKKKKRKLSRLKQVAKLPKKISVAKLRNLRRGGDELESDEKFTAALQNLPRITNETVAEHREEVLSSARKYIYPLSHSKRRVLVISVSLLIVAIIFFFGYCLSALYKFQSSSTFIYGVTQVIPFPVAKAGPSWVSYESYLFELRHTIHYYETQQHEDFTSNIGKQHLAKLKQDALDQVIDDAYVKQLAKEHHVSVSPAEVNNEIALVRSQNRLGSNDQVFRNVLSEFWGWTVDDFRRELKQQLLAQKLVAKLDTQTTGRADNALAKLNSGADFGALAKEVSDDASTKANGGDYGVAITRTNHDIAPQVIDALFKLKPGEHTDIINTGYSLEIDKVTSVSGDSVHAAHIVFNLKDINTYLKPLRTSEKPHTFIKVD